MRIFALFGRNPFAMRPGRTAATGYVKSNKAAEETDAIGNIENATEPKWEISVAIVAQAFQVLTFGHHGTGYATRWLMLISRRAVCAGSTKI